MNIMLKFAIIYQKFETLSKFAGIQKVLKKAILLQICFKLRLASAKFRRDSLNIQNKTQFQKMKTTFLSPEL